MFAFKKAVNAVASEMQFPTKLILRLMVFTETTRKRGGLWLNQFRHNRNRHRQDMGSKHLPAKLDFFIFLFKSISFEKGICATLMS